MNFLSCSLSFAAFLVLDDESESSDTEVSQQFLCLLFSYFNIRWPGSGNFEHGELHSLLVNPDPNWSPHGLLLSLRGDSYFRRMRCCPSDFLEIADVLAPWVSLPRRFSRQFFMTGLQNLVFHPLQYYQNLTTRRGRPQSLDSFDRTFLFYTFLREPMTVAAFSNHMRASYGRASIEIEHCCWAFLHALHFGGFYDFPSVAALQGMWNRLPPDVTAGFDPNFFFPLCLDITFKPLPEFGTPPANRTDYYCGKPNVKKEVFANLMIVDVTGRIAYISVGNMSRPGEHSILRNCSITSHLPRYFPDPSIKVLCDGLFQGVGFGWDQLLILPRTAPLSPIDAAFNVFHKYLRSIVENVYGAVDQLFPVIRKPAAEYDWFCHPPISLVCYGLYNLLRSKTGYLGNIRMEYLFDP
jgi:hypothetical protein